MKTSVAAIILALFKGSDAGHGNQHKFSHCGVGDSLVGWWKGKHYDGTKIPDSSKNGNDIETINDPDNSMNVVNGNYLEGNIGDSFELPTAITNSGYTLFHISKYRNTVTPNTNNQIWNSINGTWISGFNNELIGVANHEGWITQNIYSNADSSSEKYSWILSTDQTDLYRMNGQQKQLPGQTAGVSDWPKTIGININGFDSDFGFSEALLFDRELNIYEIQCMESHLIKSNKLMSVKLPEIKCNIDKLLWSPNLIGYYGANGYQNITSQIIKDMSINGNDIVNINGLITQNGNILQGTTSENFRTPFNMDSSDYTVIFIAKYNTSDVNNKKRILTSEKANANWMSGHHGNKAGIAFHQAWITAQANNVSPNDDWILSTDIKSRYRVNGIDLSINSGSNGSPDVEFPIGINIWNGNNNEYSDWALFELMIFDKQLLQNDYICMEQYMCNKAINDGLNIECNIDYLGLYKSMNNNNNNHYINKEKCMCYHKKPCQHNNIGDYTCHKKNKWGQCPTGTTDCNKFDYIQLKYKKTSLQKTKLKTTTKQHKKMFITKKPKTLKKKTTKKTGKKGSLKCCHNIKKPCLHNIKNYCMDGYGKGLIKKCWGDSTYALCAL